MLCQGTQVRGYRPGMVFSYRRPVKRTLEIENVGKVGDWLRSRAASNR